MEKCVFIGYPDGYKGWKFHNPITKKVIISERAEFDERHKYDGQCLVSTMDHTPSPEDHVSSAPQNTCIHLSPIPEPSTTSSMNGNQDDQDPNPQPQNEPVPQDPIIDSTTTSKSTT